MTQFSQPWAGQVLGDSGAYDDDQWSDMYKNLFLAGVANQGVRTNYLNELVVTISAVGPPGTIQVDTGGALVDGKWYTNDAAVTEVQPAAAAGSYLVVLAKTWATQEVRIDIRIGAALVQNDGVLWEIPLASFTLAADGTISALVSTREFLSFVGDAGRVRVLKVMPPATLGATIDYRAGGSAPAEQYMIWDFDKDTVEYMDFLCRLESYEGNGLTFTLPWSADGVTVNDVIWSIGIRAIPDDAEDVDAAHVYDYNDVTDTAPSADGELSYPTIAFTDGVDMDNWADGELAIVRIRRRADQGGDTLDADAQLWFVSGVES